MAKKNLRNFANFKNMKFTDMQNYDVFCNKCFMQCYEKCSIKCIKNDLFNIIRPDITEICIKIDLKKF